MTDTPLTEERLGRALSAARSRNQKPRGSEVRVRFGEPIQSRLLTVGGVGAMAGRLGGLSGGRVTGAVVGRCADTAGGGGLSVRMVNTGYPGTAWALPWPGWLSGSPETG